MVGGPTPEHSIRCGAPAIWSGKKRSRGKASPLRQAGSDPSRGLKRLTASIFRSVKGQAMKVLITGGAGFIGSNFVLHMLEEHPGYNIVVVDKLTYAGNLGNLAAVLDGSRFQFVPMAIYDPPRTNVIQRAA